MRPTFPPLHMLGTRLVLILRNVHFNNAVFIMYYYDTSSLQRSNHPNNDHILYRFIHCMAGLRHERGRERNPTEWWSKTKGRHSQGVGSEPQDIASRRSYLSAGHRKWKSNFELICCCCCCSLLYIFYCKIIPISFIYLLLLLLSLNIVVLLCFNDNSKFRPTKSDVPYESVMGPLHFIPFINDLPDSFNSIWKIFADDIRLLSSVNYSSKWSFFLY